MGNEISKHTYKNRGRRKTNEEFIQDARIKHGEKYDYTKVNYKNAKTKVCIICPNHGEFWQAPSDHLSGNGCPFCKFDKSRNTIEEFVEKANEIHRYKYDYSKVEYKNNATKVCIICPKHGEFWKTPNLHMSQKQGCPICSKENKKKSRLEDEIDKFLSEHEIEFYREYKTKWMGGLSIDFYLPKYNVGIECQGIQHFKHSGSEKSYYTKEKIEEIKKRDTKKKKLCGDNNLKLLYYSNLGIEYPYKVYEDKEELLNEILNKDDTVRGT